ncbi:hypothetical protein [Novosphingobium mathurense]|uniref:Uncharacterized protein n=1 Tax=Novosphingobium mathurense TaxID=428990 RepID=A0A1U6I7F5_9SPHN|nr:hypothetical protein [Novosphingobium mathurense]SLK03944.1 hypothetical protein SAMN06295987_104311 [Novosphingobium mathurense]
MEQIAIIIVLAIGCAAGAAYTHHCLCELGDALDAYDDLEL